MHYHPSRFIYYQNIIVFVNNIERQFFSPGNFLIMFGQAFSFQLFQIYLYFIALIYLMAGFYNFAVKQDFAILYHSLDNSPGYPKLRFYHHQVP